MSLHDPQDNIFSHEKFILVIHKLLIYFSLLAQHLVSAVLFPVQWACQWVCPTIEEHTLVWYNHSMGGCGLPGYWTSVFPLVVD